jgi:GTP:adenosylcobinamide-phosphate guanylyltransferase
MTTFFGGMGLSYVTDCNEIVQDIRTPFVNVVSTMTRFADSTMTGTVPLWARAPRTSFASPPSVVVWCSV